MQHRPISYFFACFCVAILFLESPLLAQSPPSKPPKDTLSVGVAGNEPFVLGSNNTGNLHGIAIEIWEDLANKKNWPYRYRTFNTVHEALNVLDNGSLDLVVGPISITSLRVARMRFSQPYYQSSLAIVSRKSEPGLWERIKPFFSAKLLVALGMFLSILAIVGTLLWLAERKKSPEQFPPDPIRGIGNGMWLAIVTMSTTGYGDMAPITLRGRIIAGAWMVITIIFATSMVAGIASTLTLSGLGSSVITNVEQLSGKNVATILGSPAEAFLKEHNCKEVAETDLNEAIAKLNAKEVDAVVYDRPQLLYFLKNHMDEKLYIAKAEYYKQGYGFAFPLTSDLVHEVNRSLLELAEERTVERTIDYYLGEDK
ncbi:transporter substrate-binding domain-containing protein [Flavobacteriaceae bacterium F89]|uniref:Transporter substrate-binding domain-containing protein n=1 Tax=Cerina litoralis TaxID=2874477 RepID=A0AAE3EYZ3_9FLAO|nr:transporter substrate-binding domain-containing protein [Cerina litoralis]MCG2462759.1 transporter substrate-binding domain-containing protein [Cerina litoralis]